MLHRVFLCTGREDITKVLVQVCAVLSGQSADIAQYKPRLRRNAIEMMLLTIAAESVFIHRSQIGGGPARGLMQMEPATALDTFRWIHGALMRSQARIDIWSRLTDIWLALRDLPRFTPTEEEVGWHLMTNDAFMLALGRLHYRMFPEPFPDSLDAQAAYWKKYWNTPAGARPPEHAVANWIGCECDWLVELAGRLATLE
jgi:hypothetical protein